MNQSIIGFIFHPITVLQITKHFICVPEKVLTWSSLAFLIEMVNTFEINSYLGLRFIIGYAEDKQPFKLCTKLQTCIFVYCLSRKEADYVSPEVASWTVANQ